MTEASRPYELHRSLLAAFPDKATGGSGRVLFRLDIDREAGGMSVLVQSEVKPDWSKLRSADGFITECKSKRFEPEFVQDQVLRFRLRANPTRRNKDNGRRQGVLGQKEQIKWLRKKGLQSGFEIIDATVIDEGFAEDKMTTANKNKHVLTLLSTRFDGLLRVVGPDVFRQTVENGIGSGKGFGFGLLSVAKYRG
ncbi:MAG: type I-E CRISPR-associated protein Cas6/Cse3/CasE [Dehalococcoidia bacterium]